MSSTPVNATRAWFQTLDDLLTHGQEVAPRGQRTFELPQHTMVIDMNYPVVQSPTRKVSAKFLGGEAYWILSGDDRVETIEPYNPHIAQFSDDGRTFFGAYGPRIVAQLKYVVGKLLEDPDTRQAGLTLWRENPPATKDVPCTISMFFSIRDGRLNNHVFMRSSDVWLGVPYDVFNFSMVALLVCTLVNKARPPEDILLEPGNLHLTAASRHLYRRNLTAAIEVLSRDPWHVAHNSVPPALWINTDELMEKLDKIRSGDRGARWWL